MFLTPGSRANRRRTLTVDLPYVIDGGGVVPTIGLKGFVPIDFNCQIVSAQLLADQTGSAVVDIFKCTFAQFDAGATHPVSGDKITGSTPLTLSSSVKLLDTTLSGWTTTVNAGDILTFNLNSVTTITRVTVTLKVIRR